METCTVETGLLRKKPCVHASVTHCANCERALCAEHAVPQLTDIGKKSGKFMCKECDIASREHDKSVAAAERKEKVKAPPAAAAKKPAEPPASPAPAASKPKEEDSLGGIDFTPTKK